MDEKVKIQVSIGEMKLIDMDEFLVNQPRRKYQAGVALVNLGSSCVGIDEMVLIPSVLLIECVFKAHFVECAIRGIGGDDGGYSSAFLARILGVCQWLARSSKRVAQNLGSVVS